MEKLTELQVNEFISNYPKVKNIFAYINKLTGVDLTKYCYYNRSMYIFKYKNIYAKIMTLSYATTFSIDGLDYKKPIMAVILLETFKKGGNGEHHSLSPKIQNIKINDMALKKAIL